MTDEELRLILRLRDDVLQARERLLDDALRAREAIRPSIEAAFDAFSQGRSFASMLAETHKAAFDAFSQGRSFASMLAETHKAAFDAFSQGRSFASMLAGQEAATAPPRWEPEIYLPSYRREAVLPSEPEPPEPIRRRIGFAAW